MRFTSAWKMTRSKKLAIVSVILIAIGYISKPDRGGVWRCAKIFEMPELQHFHVSHRPFWMWKPFESPKFRFRISPSDLSRLDAALKLNGYPAWIKGGVTYGSVSHGWEADDDYVYCQSKRGGYSYTWSYSAKENLIYAIQFP